MFGAGVFLIWTFWGTVKSWCREVRLAAVLPPFLNCSFLRVMCGGVILDRMGIQAITMERIAPETVRIAVFSSVSTLLTWALLIQDRAAYSSTESDSASQGWYALDCCVGASKTNLSICIGFHILFWLWPLYFPDVFDRLMFCQWLHLGLLVFPRAVVFPSILTLNFN